MTHELIKIELGGIIERMSNGCNVQTCCISPGPNQGRCICGPRELRMQLEGLRIALEGMATWPETNGDLN